MVQHVPVPFVDTPLTSNVREAVERDWSTNLNGPAVRLYGGEESAAFRVGDVVIRIGPAWRQLAELELFQLVRVRLRTEVRAASAIASALDADDEEYRLRQIEVFRRLTKLATRPGSAP